jgi:glycosyltransferase involved in cell wall biosynthesis
LGVSDWVKKVRPRKKVLQKYLPSKVVGRGYIFYDSGANPSKNIEGLIKSYSEILQIYESKKNSNYPYLVIAGRSFTENTDSYITKISKLIEDLSLQDKIFFTGYFEDEDLSDLICGSKLGINLSFYEGFGFGALQVMKAGIPLIASNTSCYPEVLGDGAKLVDPDNHKKVAQIAYSLLSDKRRSMSLAKKGVEQAKKYTWDKTAKETYEYFGDIIKENKK